MIFTREKKYRIYRSETGETIATSRFAGKTVRGVAKCNPSDKYNEEVGEQLAVLRCAAKINKKRIRNAKEKLAVAKAELEKAQSHYAEMLDYLVDSKAERVEIELQLKALDKILED